MALTLSSAQIDSGGTILSTGYSGAAAAMDPNSYSGMTVKVNGSPVTIQTVSAQLAGVLHPAVLFFVFDQPFYATDVVAISLASSNITDGISGTVADVSGFAVVNGSGQVAPPDALVVWTYSNKTQFNLFNGSNSTDIESDLNSVGTGNDGVLAYAGARGDNYINTRLAAIGFPVPLTGMDAMTTQYLETMSNYACRWLLADNRNYALLVSGGDAKSMAALGLSDKKMVDDMLDAIADEMVKLTAAGDPFGTGSENLIPAPVVASPNREFWPGRCW